MIKINFVSCESKSAIPIRTHYSVVMICTVAGSLMAPSLENGLARCGDACSSAGMGGTD